MWCRTKLKQTEVDCDFLKRCCENLTEENRRLQKEVQELRALKLLSPQVYMHIAPPTTLILCPSCERVSNNSTTSACGTAPSASDRPSNMPWMPIPIRPTIQRSWLIIKFSISFVEGSFGYDHVMIMQRVWPYVIICWYSDTVCMLIYVNWIISCMILKI